MFPKAEELQLDAIPITPELEEKLWKLFVLSSIESREQMEESY